MRRRRIWGATAGAVLAVVWTGGCTTVKTENRVTVDPIEVRVEPITLNVRADVNLILKMEREAQAFAERVLGNRPQSLLRWLFGASPAYAAEGDAERAAYEAADRRSEARGPEIQRWLDRGCVGLDNEGHLALRACEGLSDTEARGLRDFVEATNADFEIVYRWRAAEDGVAIEAERIIQARTFHANARAGHWIQSPSDPVEFRRFLRSDLGERIREALGADLAKGAWYRIPSGYRPRAR